MPATEPIQKRRQVGSDAPGQARSPQCCPALMHPLWRPAPSLAPAPFMAPTPFVALTLFVAPDTAGRAPPLGPTPPRPDADPKLLSTKHAALPSTASDALRLPTWQETPWIWIDMTVTRPNRHGSRRCPCPVTSHFVLIERRPTFFKVPASHLLSTLRSPAVMHKPAGQRYLQIPLLIRSLFLISACRGRHAENN
jgi:hypothetical protein